MGEQLAMGSWVPLTMHSKTRLNTQTVVQPMPGLRLAPLENLAAMRELDYRFVNGLQVQLWWESDTGCVWVSVRDARSEQEFLIEVKDGEQPLDVFHHPFAYAPGQRLASAFAAPQDEDVGVTWGGCAPQ
jgi:hypothetical protein